MTEERNRRVRPPLAYRLYRFFGGLFGLNWVPDNHLGVVYRMEMYHSLRGPGFFRIDPFSESVKRVVSLNPDFISTNIPSLQTQDAVQLGLRIALAYVFDPRPLPREKALVFVQWPKHILRAIVIDNVTTALQAIMPGYAADRVCRGQVFEDIRQKLMAELKERLSPLAMEPILALVLEVTVPPALQNTFTAVANRAAYTVDLSQYEPFELNEVRRRELYEVLSTLPGGIRYLNVWGGDAATAAWQVGGAPSRRVIPGEARELPRIAPDIQPDEPTRRHRRSPRSHLWPSAEVPPEEWNAEDEDDDDD